jgi:hypothetical protein
MEASVSETASEIAEGLHAVSEAMTDVAGVLAYHAATQYNGTAGEQRQIAAVMFHTACKRFGGVKYDGRKIEDFDLAELDALWIKMTGGKRLKR